MYLSDRLHALGLSGAAGPSVRAPFAGWLGEGDGSHFMGRASCALAIFAALLASTTPSPLYQVYVAEWDLPASAGTTIFSVYALGTLLALFLSGRIDRRISDRRQVLLPALVCTAIGALVFAAADGVGMLLAGRLLSGVSTGLITSAASAAILELDLPERRGRAATVATVAFTGGAAFGPCLSSAALAAGLAPLVSPFLAIAVIAAIAFLGLSAAPWPPRRRQAGPAAKAARTVRPLAGTELTGGLFRLACLAIAVAWMLGSMLMAMGVTLATDLFGLTFHALAGLMPALFQLFAGIGQVLAGRVRPIRAILAGTALLALLPLATLVGAAAALPAVFVLAMPLCGLAYGAAFAGGAALVNAISEPTELGARIARFYVVGYLANAIPTFVFGYMVDAFGLSPAYAGFTLCLALAAAAGVLLALRSQRALARGA
ncbi:MFS transporter [Poseidonocella sp. HB161398]|uniref:MFS transporter n=1 Tax=Poseidonocella sp. HB161398 TaxID=2320855 RepID=UPI0011096DC2|nr:MFS transporter [Poseidonocella sp. HB161398]